MLPSECGSGPRLSQRDTERRKIRAAQRTTLVTTASHARQRSTAEPSHHDDCAWNWSCNLKTSIRSGKARAKTISRAIYLLFARR